MRLQISDDRLAVRLSPIGEGWSRLTVEYPRERRDGRRRREATPAVRAAPAAARPPPRTRRGAAADQRRAPARPGAWPRAAVGGGRAADGRGVRRRPRSAYTTRRLSRRNRERAR